MKTTQKNISAILTLLVIVFGGWFVLNSQNVLDWWKLRSYVPSEQIANLSNDASFSDIGRRLFYVHDPALLPKADFKGKCTVGEETIVLGCYLSHEKIYVFDVDDVRLEGVEQVTAAHEMLHAVYDRLSTDEKRDLDSKLVAFYESLKDPRLTKTVENYRSRDPTVVPNELHSILGTEVSELPTDLEEHYSKYFINRQTVVTLSEAYEKEFTLRQSKVEEYDTQLKQLSVSIDSQENQIRLLGDALSYEQANLQSLRSQPEQFNSAVPEFNKKVKNYNYLLEKLKSDIEEYNSIVEQRNVIASEEQDLVNAIDSRSIELE